MTEISKGVPVVYRVFDDHGFCLYVGSTINFPQRLSEHTGFAKWWQKGITIDVRPYPTQAEALAAEAVAIVDLKPRFNVKGRGPRATWSAAQWVEVLCFSSASSTLSRWIGMRRDFTDAYPHIAEVVLPHVVLPPIYRHPCGCPGPGLECDHCTDFRAKWIKNVEDAEEFVRLRAA